MDALSDPLINRKFYDSFSGNEDTFQDDGSKQPLNVSKINHVLRNKTKVLNLRTTMTITSQVILKRNRRKAKNAKLKVKKSRRERKRRSVRRTTQKKRLKKKELLILRITRVSADVKRRIVIEKKDLLSLQNIIISLKKILLMKHHRLKKFVSNST